MARSSSLPFSFPVELFRPIIQHLERDRAALYTISLTSKVFQMEGQRLLYCRITHLKTEADHIKFLASVVASERLALLVDVYSQYAVVNPGSLGGLWDLLGQGLRAMKNLKSLRFRSRLGRASAEILQGCTFQLENLSWSCSGDEKELAKNFFPFQHKLKRLNIIWKESIHMSTLSPDLALLGGSRGAIEAFLPSRKVTSLMWIPDREDPPSDPIDHLSSQFNHLQHLSFGGYFGRPDLTLIICHLQSLEVLELIDHSAEEVCILSQIPKLRWLILSHQWTNPLHPGVPLDTRADTVKAIFSACSNLQYIDITHKDMKFQRWIPSASEPLGQLISYRAATIWWQFIPTNE